MAMTNEDKTTFHTEKGTFCYTKMPFGLRNTGAMYHRLVDKVVDQQIGWNIEVCVDDMVTKRKNDNNFMVGIEETLKRLRQTNMKLNPKKCVFWGQKGKFLGHIVTESGIEAN